MATQTDTQTDSISLIKAIIANPNYHHFSDLSSEETQFFTAAFLLNNGQFGPYTFDSPDAAFSTFKENPELLDTLFVANPDNDILHQTEAIDQAVLARLVSEYHLSQEQIESDIQKKNPYLTKKQINLLTKLYLINQANLTVTQIVEKSPDTHTTSSIIDQTNPKKDPHQTLTEIGHEIATVTAAAAGINITEEQALKFNQILAASANLSTETPPPPLKIHLETITSKETSPPEQLAAATALVETLVFQPELTSKVFEEIRTSPVETTTKEILVQTLDRAISTQKTTTPPTTPKTREDLAQISSPPIPNQETSSLSPETLVTSLQEIPQAPIIIKELPPESPIREHLETITSKETSPPEQLAAATAIIETIGQSPETLTSITSAIINSPLPEQTKADLTQTLNQTSNETTTSSETPTTTETTPTIKPQDLQIIVTTLQENPEIATPIQSISPSPLSTDTLDTPPTPIDPITLEATLALTTDEFQSPIATITRQIADNLDPVTATDISNLPGNEPPPLINTSTNTTLDTNDVHLPSDTQIDEFETSFDQKLTIVKPDIKELTLQFIEENKSAVTAVAISPATTEILDQIAPQATPEFVDKFANAIRHDLPMVAVKAFSDPHSAQAEAIASGMGHKDVAAGIKLHALLVVKPENLKTVVDFAHTHPDSELGKLLQKNPEEFLSAIKNAKDINNSILGQEINNILNRPSPGSNQTTPTQLSPIQNIFKKVTEPFNRVASFFNNKIPQIPGIGKYLNAVTHPVQFIKNWIGRKIGENFVKQIGQRIGQAVLKRIGNEFAKKAINTLLKEGLKKAAQLILKQAAIRGLQVAAQALNAVPGLGIAVAIALEIGSRIIGKIKGALDSLAMSIWGEKLKARDLGAAAGALIAAPVAVAVAIATAAVTTAATAISTTIIMAAAIGGFFYLSAVTIAPIIGSFAQLGLPTAGIGIGAGTYIPNPDDTFNDANNSAGSCFVFSESIYPWSDQQKSIIRPLVSQLPNNYLSKICSGGEITLTYGGDNGSIGGFVQGNNISIYNAGFNFYTLAHESGHIFSHHHPSVYQNFANDTGILSEGAVDTYPLGSSAGDSEDFAESIAIYLSKPSYLSSKYPKHYNFVKNYIFN